MESFYKKIFVSFIVLLIPFYGNAAWDTGLSDAQKDQYWNYYNATKKFAESQRARVEQLEADKIAAQQKADAVAASINFSDAEKKRQLRVLDQQISRADRQIQTAEALIDRRIDTFEKRIDKARAATQKRVDQIVKSISKSEEIIARQAAGVENMPISDMVQKQQAAIQMRKEALDAAKKRLCDSNSCGFNGGCVALCR